MGKAIIKKYDGGRLVEEREVSNFITAAGEKLLADRCTDKGEAEIGWIAVGTGSGQTRDDNALDSELARQALDGTYPKQGTDEREMQFFATFAAGTGTGTWSEAGLFNDATVGDMVNYYEIDPAIEKLSTQSITLKIYIMSGSGV
jgi:hypothetical protein